MSCTHSPGGGVVLALEQELVPGQDDPLGLRGGRARPLEVEVVGLVGEDRRKLSAVPEVPQPHLAAGEVGVQHTAQDFNAARGQALCANRIILLRIAFPFTLTDINPRNS